MRHEPIPDRWYNLCAPYAALIRRNSGIDGRVRMKKGSANLRTKSCFRIKSSRDWSFFIDEWTNRAEAPADKRKSLCAVYSAAFRSFGVGDLGIRCPLQRVPGVYPPAAVADPRALRRIAEIRRAGLEYGRYLDGDRFRSGDRDQRSLTFLLRSYLI